MHLLLIEDDPALHTTLQRSLVRAQMRVDVCSDGSLALDHWRSAEPDVVVLDLSLPGVDGLDILK
ncbi:MAG: response regulator, partial [Burkholderiaceae bacterium]|nr:response regulator [Burkholderiaceae bacterium]